MLMNNKTFCVSIVALCLTAVSLPSHAWRAAGAGGAGVARGTYGGAAAWNRNTGNVAVRGPNGNTATWNRNNTYYRPPVPAYGYRPPVYYGGNYGYSSGQVAAAGVAGLAVGAMAGAAVANSNQPSSTTVVVQQPAPTSLAIGTNLNNLPGSCNRVMFNSIQYYQCGSSWLRAYSGYYQVVPAPY